MHMLTRSHYRVVEFSELRNEPGLVKVRLKQWRPSWAAQPGEQQGLFHRGDVGSLVRV